MKPRLAFSARTRRWVCWLPKMGQRYYLVVGSGPTPKAAYDDWARREVLHIRRYVP